MSTPVSDLPIMKATCKTCPFRIMENGREQDMKLAGEVTSRTLFQGQQICHGTEGKNRKPTHRCKGSWDNNMVIYTRMGVGDKIK